MITIVNSIFKGINHGDARTKLIKEFHKYKFIHAQIIEHVHHAFVPDINVCINSVEWFIECKVRNDRLSIGQRLWMTCRIQAGGKCAMVNWQNDVIKVYDYTTKNNSIKHLNFLNITEIVSFFIKRSDELKVINDK